VRSHLRTPSLSAASIESAVFVVRSLDAQHDVLRFARKPGSLLQVMYHRLKIFVPRVRGKADREVFQTLEIVEGWQRWPVPVV
jgi:hypothetical protein